MKWLLLLIALLCAAQAATLALLAKTLGERDQAREMCALLMARKK